MIPLNSPSYVLITPARNEAEFLELTIQSVVAQTVRPVKWVIVSDGSTDGTDQLVEKYAAQNPWIELLRMPERKERHFAGKIHAFNAGYAKVRELSWEMIGSMDADISFDRDYFSFLLQEMAKDPALGLVGTPFREKSGQTYDYRFVNIEHVSGACQLFRRECFEDIGGYVPVKGGGVDHIAVVTARMKGWKTRTFTDMTCLHHRPMGAALSGELIARFKFGIRDYAFGNHPLWEPFRVLYQFTKRPFILGGVFLLSGYVWACLRRTERPVSRELVAFQRREQMQRLRKLITGTKTPSAQPSRYA
jgi:glycosyltransferase involved in cell wall biosynthesis